MLLFDLVEKMAGGRKVSTYKGLAGAYVELLKMYETTRKDSLAKPADQNVQTAFVGVKNSRNLVFGALLTNFGAMKARYDAVRAGTKFD